MNEVIKTTVKPLTRMEAARAVVEYAKYLGFDRARVAVWRVDDGDPCEAADPVAEMIEYDPMPPMKNEHTIGVYLMETVYSAVVNGPGDDDENPVGKTFDTREERDEWYRRHNPA